MRNNNYNRPNGSSRRPKGNGRRLDASVFVKKACPPSVQNVESLSQSRFTDYSVVAKMQQNIAQHGYVTPTDIQAQAIPEILAGRDLIGSANTGTGKTAAFLITLINKCYLDRSQKALIVVPTRELALQLAAEFKIFAQ